MARHLRAASPPPAALPCEASVSNRSSTCAGRDNRVFICTTAKETATPEQRETHHIIQRLKEPAEEIVLNQHARIGRRPFGAWSGNGERNRSGNRSSTNTCAPRPPRQPLSLCESEREQRARERAGPPWVTTLGIRYSEHAGLLYGVVHTWFRPLSTATLPPPPAEESSW